MKNDLTGVRIGADKRAHGYLGISLRAQTLHFAPLQAQETVKNAKIF